MTTRLQSSLAAIDEAIATPVEFEALVARVGPKDRINLEKHLAVCEAEPDPNHAKVWRRLVCTLATLAPHATRTVGRQTTQFFIPDGKYRQQVFALHDLSDGTIAIYCGNADKDSDVLKEAVKAGFISHAQDNVYRIAKSKEGIEVDELDGKTANPQPFFKDMLGWNRKALRITVRTSASDDQVHAVERLCALAARKWNIAPA